MNCVFIVSDGTGQTAEMALNAALTQFSGIDVNLERRPQIDTMEKVTQVVAEAACAKAFIIHTLVSDKMREHMVRSARLHNVETIDIMGPLLSRLSNQFALSPSEKPGLFHQMNEEYFRRVETMNFAFKHDDGLRPEELGKAEIVLVGVSRTFKTPLSIYLAFKGWLVANVPIIFNIQPPAQLFNVIGKRVFFLNTTAIRLTQLRQVRHQKLGEATGSYSSYEFVKQELKYAQNIYQNHPGWSMINVTNKSIEEIASEILALIRSD
ncbi:MAG: kinase/pyrophosphorylase [Candidatus Cloacimonetes bacterium]|nr:kinase/pyrophosphorylase [Candidatus Cloacimonadota bacterium]